MIEYTVTELNPVNKDLCDFIIYNNRRSFDVPVVPTTSRHYKVYTGMTIDISRLSLQVFYL
jgi:hypothetical protein